MRMMKMIMMVMMMMIVLVGTIRGDVGIDPGLPKIDSKCAKYCSDSCSGADKFVNIKCFTQCIRTHCVPPSHPPPEGSWMPSPDRRCEIKCHNLCLAKPGEKNCFAQCIFTRCGFPALPPTWMKAL
ncbi:uncharacterized protein LOC112084672 [Eutrema salsugineum]|uniref:uncharacterized protein LOC112084672 n=1 Tax=Eutrema salsugineum TaxID=72664 RepID=UPI000CED4EC6|nr:uncharacterized protein LOC112084672 [Eutrema salsugineum]